MLPNSEIDLLRNASHPDPFSVLGPHRDGGGKDKRLRVRAFLPGAAQVDVLAADGATRIAALPQRHADGFFEGALPAGASTDYRFKVQWTDGAKSILDDPYRFPAVLGEMDVWLMGEGSHLRPYEVLGATQREMLGVAGTSFAVWAPNATRVSVVGDFNAWDGRRHPMRLRRECGIWEIFIPMVTTGAVYKYELRSREGRVLPLKADPYALQSELRPATASVVTHMPPLAAPSSQRQRANALDAPVSIYEVHLGSWRRKVEHGNGFLSWDELADTLAPYARDMGFTHIELLPVSEHPFDGSWGYQPVGLYAPTSRFGDAPGFRRFVDRCHAEGLGVLLDWVPAHFPSDPHGLAVFDGTHLYEHSDPREGFHQDWNTLIYNFGRTEVSNFLVANALYWLERYNVDGLRVDAVASMLYRDYSRKPGDWVPNVHGGRENLEAVAFLKRMNEVVGVERPPAVTLAEESTAFPSVSRPTFAGGLGFHYKWNMGWMHDTLAYIARDPIHRKYHHNELSFGLVYAFNENFVLPISHDEVVHGKGSLLAKMPGDRWQKFANLRAYLGFMFGHPGKKLLFMGCEFAQVNEWNHDQSLDWHLLDDPTPANLHAGVQRLLRDLNRLYRATPALYQRDFDGSGFEWIDHQDSERSVLSFVRRGHGRPQADYIRRPPPEGDEETSGGRAFPHEAGSFVVVVCNFTPTVHPGFRVGVPEPGVYRERLNTDSQHYGGSNVGTPYGEVSAQAIAWNGRAHCIEFALPPLATVIFEWKAP